MFEVEHLVTHVRYALKWLRFEVDGVEAAHRVAAQVNEARAVVHPSMAGVSEVVVEGTSLFVISELVIGDSLHWALSPHALPRSQRLRLVCQAMNAVAEAHAQGVVHRGLHPGNILVSVSDGKPQAKVVDFVTSQLNVGPHALMQSTAVRSAQRTLDAHVYLAPEQLRSSEGLDSRSDVYPLAAIAYQALTGRVPRTASNIFDLAVRIATTPLEPASLSCPGVPRALDEALAACLAYDRNGRPRTVHELVRELTSFASRESEPTASKHYATTELFVQPRGSRHAPIAAPLPPAPNQAREPIVEPQLPSDSADSAKSTLVGNGVMYDPEVVAQIVMRVRAEERAREGGTKPTQVAPRQLHVALLVVPAALLAIAAALYRLRPLNDTASARDIPPAEVVQHEPEVLQSTAPPEPAAPARAADAVAPHEPLQETTNGSAKPAERRPAFKALPPPRKEDF